MQSYILTSPGHINEVGHEKGFMMMTASSVPYNEAEAEKLDLIEVGRACGALWDDVALLVGREQAGVLSEEERDELQRLRRLEVV